MKHLRSAGFIIILMTSILLLVGCFKEIAPEKRPLPEIVWPKPPETPRIRFVNSVSRPEDLNIKENTLRRFFRFLKKGETGKSIVKPYGVITDADGRLFVVDNFNRFVHVFDTKDNIYYTFPHKETTLISPIDIAIDMSGNIYVSDSKEAVIKVFRNHGRKYINEIGRGVLKRPTGIAVNKKTGELLIVDTLRSEIVRYDIKNSEFKGKIGGKGSEPGNFHYPTNIFVSSDGHIIVSDSLNFRVQIFSPEGIFLRTFGKPGDSPGYFARPRGVATDSDGNIYVVDALFDNVQVFNAIGKLLMDFGGPGNGYGEFWLPSGIYIDNNDRIYVADSYNNRIQIFQYMKGESLLNP
jgi:DNA-binding beta-propeller fold protein YncE